MSNPLRGIGAVNTTPTTALALRSPITSLGTQYNYNSSGIWPNKGTSMGLAVLCAGSQSVFFYTNAFDQFKLVLGNNVNGLAPDGPIYGGTGIATNSTGTYIGISSTSTPYYVIWKRNLSTFTQISTPAYTSSVNNIAFSNDGNYMALAINSNSGQFAIYKITSGDTFTKLANPATMPGSLTYDIAFTPDNKYLIMCMPSSPYIYIYKIDSATDTFTKLANPSSLPTAGSLGCISISGDSVYMALGGTGVNVYKIDSTTDTFTKLSVSLSSVGTGTTVRISPDGTYIASGGGSPYNTYIHKRSGDTFSLIQTLTEATGFAGTPRINYIMFSHDNNYLSVSVAGTGDNLIIYKRSGDTFTKITTSYQYPGSGYGTATAWIPAV